MLLRKAIQKTKVFFHKTLQSLKSFLFGGYQKLPKSQHHPLINPLYCSNNNNHHPNMDQLDQFYKDFSEQWESNNDKTKKKSKKTFITAKEPMEEDVEEQSDLKSKEEQREKEEREMESSNGGGYMLAQKMRELEKMEMNDVDHVLDIEEVLHYYSRLRCPVYLDIVDKFFMDMYSEFHIPNPSPP